MSLSFDTMERKKENERMSSVPLLVRSNINQGCFTLEILLNCGWIVLLLTSFLSFWVAANITGHYMAKGKRVLITSKSPEALKVISDKIGGKNGVFEVGSKLKKLIFSWGDQKEAHTSFESAAETLKELCGPLKQEVEIAANLEKIQRLSNKISVIEEYFRTTSTVGFKTLKELSEDGPEKSELVDMSKTITCLKEPGGSLDELCYRTPRELADLIRGDPSEKEELGLFSSFVSKDLKQAFKTENGRNQLVAWFESASECRDQVVSLKQRFPVESETAAFLRQVKEAGLQTWAHAILKVIRGKEEVVDTVIPHNWQRYMRLVCCLIFLENLSEKLPRAHMDNIKIGERKRLEKDRQGAFKAVVERETLREAMARYKLPGFSRSLATFIDTYKKASKMFGKKTTKKSAEYYKLQHNLQTMLQDGKLLDALPIWIMPTDIVSEMLPATFGLFDVVILEEASQSNCLAIPALFRGKKLIVIGDEKQVNPPASTEDYKQFISQKLGSGLPQFTRDNLLPGKSVFDLFATAFNGSETTVVLREHFR